MKELVQFHSACQLISKSFESLQTHHTLVLMPETLLGLSFLIVTVKGLEILIRRCLLNILFYLAAGKFQRLFSIFELLIFPFFFWLLWLFSFLGFFLIFPKALLQPPLLVHFFLDSSKCWCCPRSHSWAISLPFSYLPWVR